MTTSVIILIVVIILIITPEGIVQQLLALLADDGLLVSALNVVPLDPVLRCERSHVGLSSNVMTHAVDVVEDADAGLLPAALLLLPVVRLALPEAARVAPLTVAAAPGGRDPLACGGPVPAILYGGLQVTSLAPGEVALPAASPDVGDVLASDDIPHPVILRPRADADGVHAELSAVVPRLLPGPLPVLTFCQPGEVVGLSKSLSVNNS